MKLIIYLFCTPFLFSQPGEWVTLPNAPMVSRFNDINFINENQGWAVNGWGQIYYTPDGGDSWELQLNQENSHFRSIRFFDSMNGWAGNVGYGEFGALDTTKLYQTSNGGESWEPFDDFIGPEPAGICGLQVVNDTVMCAVGRVRGPAFFTKTMDQGDTWVSTDLSEIVAGLIDLYFFDPDTGFIVGLTNESHSQSSGIVLRTVDGGESWEPMIITSRQGEWAWKISFPSRQVGYVSLQRNYEAPIYFLKTLDGGEIWEERLFSENYYFVQGIGFVNDTLGWIGGNSSHPSYETTDGGNSWSSAGFGSRMNRVQFINQNVGYACGRTVYKYSNTLNIVWDINTHSILPENPVINYPNPFNPSTTILAYLPESGTVNISILDILGRTVRTLINEKVFEGETWQEILWDGKNDQKKQVPGGIYFCRILNGTTIIQHKMVLIK